MRTTRAFAATLALTAAATVAAAPAHAAPNEASQAGVHYVAQESGSLDGGSLDDPVVGAGLVLVAGLGVSVALAVSAGIAGGAFELPQIPGLPF
ncbi:hypothetical protein G6030_04155 [Dietzia sp. E1]|uniref:hypothetical protein n=1 Tax=Dietzia sp. E1 TaxID=328361 RepID=UPI0001F6475E|nr:hypothetical protein [Dietzia sp. E1]EFV92045.1 hypothetical protein ES5_07951 [Dietzia cinnamea P4]MBB1020488.1 hypothetical protein [Dietzia sp. E1]